MKSSEFDLISAYLDNEVTVDERRLVENLLANDPEAKRVYHQLLKLESAFQSMPIEMSRQMGQQTIDSVFDKLDQESKRSWRWKTGAIVALCVAALSGVILGKPLQMEFAQLSKPESTDGLMIALNEPVVDILDPNAAGIAINEPVVPIPPQRK